MEKVTVKSSLIEANELIKSGIYGKSDELSVKEISKLIGQKIWLAAEILGIELD